MWRHATSFFFAVIPAIINSSISQYPVVSYLFFLFSSPLSVGAVACAIFPLLFCLSPHLSFLFTTPVSHPSWPSSDTISLTATSHSSTSIVILPIFWLPFRLSFAFSVHLFYCLFSSYTFKALPWCNICISIFLRSLLLLFVCLIGLHLLCLRIYFSDSPVRCLRPSVRTLRPFARPFPLASSLLACSILIGAACIVSSLFFLVSQCRMGTKTLFMTPENIKNERSCVMDYCSHSIRASPFFSGSCWGYTPREVHSDH